jgi:Uma2 family endonuclease
MVTPRIVTVSGAGVKKRGLQPSPKGVKWRRDVFMIAALKPFYTLEEYFELDRNAEGKFHYFDGKVVEVSGVSPQHATIEVNLIAIIHPIAWQRGDEAFPASMRVRVPALPTYRYPDLSVVCDKAEVVEIGEQQCLVNPVLLVEVLSDSTESYDLNGKFREYKSIETFREYVLISQTEPAVTHDLKYNERFWLQSQYAAGESLRLTTLDYDLNVDDVYRGVEFPAEPPGREI